MLEFRQQLLRLGEKLLGEAIKASDGFTAIEIDCAEKSMGMVVPETLTVFYQTLGKNERLSRSFNLILNLEDLRFEDGFLIFAEEHQRVVDWGICKSDLHQIDPEVWQRVNSSNGSEWYSEEKNFPEFIVDFLTYQF